MRKSFTRFLGLLAFFCVLGFQVSIAGVKTLVPADGKDDVVKTTNVLSMTFDYALSEGTAYTNVIQLRKVAGNVVVDQINVPSARFRFSVDMKTVYMDIEATLEEGVAYYVYFPANIVKENQPDGLTPGNPGYTTNTAWNFTVGDFTGPVLHATTPFAPVDGALHVGAAFATGNVKTSNFTLQFNEAVKGVAGKYIKIYNANGEIHEMLNAGNYNAVAAAAVNFTTASLRELTSYYILVDAGAFKDATGNPFAGITSNTAWNFTTRDYTEPVFATGYPKLGTNTGVPVAFTALGKLGEKSTFYIKVRRKADVTATPALAPTTLADFTVGTSQKVEAPTAGTEYSISVTQYCDAADAMQNLVANGTVYTVYCIAENDAKVFNNTADKLATLVKSFEVTTKDVTPPASFAVATDVYPQDGATGVPSVLDGSTILGTGPTMFMYFNEQVVKGTGTINIYNALDNSLFEALDVTNTSRVSFATTASTTAPWVGKWNVTIKPTKKLLSKKMYYVKMASGVIKDNAAGNPYGGIATEDVWNFTAEDYAAPTATWTTNSANHPLLQGTSQVTITFNENVYSDALVPPTVFNAATVAAAIDVEQNNVVLADGLFTFGATANTFTIIPSGANKWDENSTYVIKVLKNKVYDYEAASTNHNVITTELVQSYNVDSHLQPTAEFAPVTLLDKAGVITGATATVPTNQVFDIEFSEDVTLVGGTAITSANVSGLINLVEDGGPSIPFTATWNASDFVATVTPNAALTSGKSYTFTLLANYRDKNVLGGVKAPTGVIVAKYNVSDGTAPTVVADFTPTGASEVKYLVAAPINLKLTFSENIYDVPGAGRVQYTGGTAKNIAPFIILREGSATGPIVPINGAGITDAANVFTFNPVANLKQNTTYYLAFAANSVYDNAGNPNVGMNTTFVTAGIPVPVTLAPAHNATNAAGVGYVDITFNEPIQSNGLGGNILTLTKTAGGGAAGPWNCTNAELVCIGNTARFTFPGAYTLFSGASYTVTLVANAVKDAAGNLSAAIAPADWAFTAADVTAPVIANVDVPAAVGAAAGVHEDLAEPIKIVFNEEIKKGIGVIQINDGATFVQNIDVNSSLVYLDPADATNKTILIDHNPFKASEYDPAGATDIVKLYNVTMPAGTFKDMSNNPAAALTNPAGARADALAFVVDAGVTANGDKGIDDIIDGGLNAVGAVAGVWYFSTDENDAPYAVIANCLPKHLSDKNSLESDLVIEFNEDISMVAPAAVKVIIEKNIAGAGWVPDQEYLMNNAAVSISGNRINVNLTTLIANTAYRVSLATGAVEDVNGEDNDPIVAGTWIFNTNDVNGPVVTNWGVAGTLTGGVPQMNKVNRASNIVITLDEPIRLISDGGAGTNVEITSLNLVDHGAAAAANVAAGKVIKLIAGAPGAASGIYMLASIDASKKVITIDASTIAGYNAASNAQYTLYVGNTIEDGSDIPAVQQTYQFVIDDYTKPTTAVTAVTENEVGTQIVFDVNYNKKATVYYKLAANGTAKPTAASLKATGTAYSYTDVGVNESITVATAAGTEYELFVVAENVTRNILQADADVVHIPVTTADIVNPTVTAYGGNGLLNVNPVIANDFEITFGTNIIAGAGDVSIYNAVNNALVATTSDAVSPLLRAIAANKLTITVPANKLTANGSYYINIAKGYVTDDWAVTVPVPNPSGVAVNQYAGLFDNTTYTFSTKDNVGPVITGVTPYNTTNVGAGVSINNGIPVVKGAFNENIVITFNENIAAGAIGVGDITLRWPVGGGVLDNQEVILLTNPATTTISGNTLTINPIMNLVEGRQYELILKADIVKDANNNGNIASQFDFDVIDNTAPVAAYTGSTSGDIATNLIKVTDNIVITFSEFVKMLDGTNVQPADVDSLVSISDATGKANFISTIGLTPGGASVWTLDPTTNLKSSTTYTLSFGAFVKDAAGNAVLPQSVTFTTRRSESPLVVFNPIKDYATLAKDGVITVTFNQSIVQEETTTAGGTTVAEGFFSVLENSELANYFELTYGAGAAIPFNATISANKKVVTIDPQPSELTSGSDVWVKFSPEGKGGDGAAGAIPDLVDSLNNNISFDRLANPIDANVTANAAVVNVVTADAGTVEAGTIKYKVVDFVAPTMATRAPHNNYLNAVSPGNTLVITFNEKVYVGTGLVKIYREDGTLVQEIDAATLPYGLNANGTNNETQLVINPGAQARENNMKYYVMIPAGAVTDQSSLRNPFAGINDNLGWIYYTAENQSPVATTFSPANGATGVFVHENMVVKFDKNIVLGNKNIVAIYKKAAADAFDFIRVPEALARMIVDPIDTKKLTINFDRILDPQTEYYVTLEPGTVVNAVGGKEFDGIMNSTTWTFTTENTADPKLITNGLVPADNATGIAYIDNLTLQMTFDMNVAKGVGTVRVVDTATGILKESINIDNATGFGTPTITLPMTTKLMDDTRYHVFVDGGIVTNTLPSKVGFAGIGAYDAWNFTTVKDETAPTAISFSPVTTGLLNNPAFTMTFSEAIAAGTGIISIYKAADNTLVETLTATISGATATFTVPTLLQDNTNYYVKVAPDAFKDKAKTPLYYAGIADATTWTFATGDNTAPTVVSVTPDTNTNATNEFDVTIVFSENVVNVAANVSVNTGFVAVTGSGATYVARITAADAAAVTLTIGTGIKDASERNSLATAVTRTYTVGDNTAPLLTITPPATFTTTFALGLTFNEPVTIPEGAITVTNATSFSLATTDASHYILTITGAEEAVIGVTFGATITDNSVNHKAFVPVTRSYTIGDFTAPTVTADPASGTNLTNNFNVVLTFSPDAIVTSAGITVAGATTSTITNVANVFTVAITAPDNTSVTVTAANTIADEAGNLLFGTKAFTYVTGDNTKPTVVVDPVSARDTINSFDVTLIFSERVTIPTGAISVTPATATIVYSVVSGNVYKALITAPDLTTVVMSLAGTIVDNAGNTLNPVSYTYTIGDHTGPTLASFTPATGTVLTDNHPVFTMTFNEPIVKGTGSIRITKVGAASASVTIPIAGATINGNTVTLEYTAATAGGLDRNTDYFVTIDAGAVKDASNNAYAGLSTATTWTFKTGPNWVTKIDVIGSLYTVYPNPFDGFVNVKGDISQLSKVVITSITGQKVKEVPATNQISTNELRSGIYFITLYNESEAIIKTERIVKR